MKLKLLSLIHLFLFLVLFSEFKYGEINYYQITPFNSFVKLKISSNLNGKPNDTGKSKSLRRPVLGSSNEPRDTSSSQKPQSGVHQTVISPQRPILWPPTGVPRKKTTKTSPKPLSESHRWPPRGRANPIIGQNGASSADSEQSDDKWYKATKVYLREEDSDEDNDEETGLVTARLVMLSDSDTDSDSSEPETPTSKSSSSGSESDTSVPGTPVTKRFILIQNEDNLPPESAEKIQKMKNYSERTVKKILATGDVQSLIKSSKLGKRMLLISVPLLIQLLQAIFMSLTSGNTTMLSPLMVSQTKFQSRSSLSSKSSQFSDNLETANRSVTSLKKQLREEFQKKYGKECSLEFLKGQIEEFYKLYLKNAENEEEFKIISNPRKGRVENRGQKIQSFYKNLGLRMKELAEAITMFLDCYLVYLDRISERNIEPTKKKKCTWSDLMVLNFFFTAFKGFSMLYRGALVQTGLDFDKFDKLGEKSKQKLSESEKQTLKEAKPSMKKFDKLRFDYALASLISSTLLTVTGECLNYLNSEN
ncbi:Uncharacterized protein CTYZ_00002891 [Cryptosporidium tyzzeri]|nr:Uncharacterized protein CTYZ_00002891 [Cryptosporidium tyzzeri]